MPTGGVMVVIALGGVLFYYGALPVVKATKKVSHKVCHVVTIGHKCKK